MVHRLNGQPCWQVRYFSALEGKIGAWSKGHRAQQAHPTRQREAGNGTVLNFLHNLVYFGFLRR